MDTFLAHLSTEVIEDPPPIDATETLHRPIQRKRGLRPRVRFDDEGRLTVKGSDLCQLSHKASKVYKEWDHHIFHLPLWIVVGREVKI